MRVIKHPEILMATWEVRRLSCLEVGNGRLTENCSLTDVIGIYQLAKSNLDDALQSFEGVLADKPTNTIALIGKVIGSPSHLRFAVADFDR